MNDIYRRSDHATEKVLSRRHWNTGIPDAGGIPENSFLFIVENPRVIRVNRSSYGQENIGRQNIALMNPIRATLEDNHRQHLSVQADSRPWPLPTRPSPSTVTPSSFQILHTTPPFSDGYSCIPGARYRYNGQSGAYPPTSPPPLRLPAPIALPSLSPHAQVRIHPLISYHRSQSGRHAPLYWNVSLPPFNALLAPALRGVVASRWLNDTAVKPMGLSSMTIRMRRVERPIVVFPSNTGSPILICDVLKAVYEGARTAALEAVGIRSIIDIGDGDFATDEVATAKAIRRLLRRALWWGGLRESSEEADVFILELFET